MFLLRHGQSYFNLLFTATRVDPGIEDPELTPLGIEQAEAAAMELAEFALTRIIVSPYTRALQTAQPILAVHPVPVYIMHEVRERAAFACDIGSPPHRLADRFPHHDFTHLPALLQGRVLAQLHQRHLMRLVGVGRHEHVGRCTGAARPRASLRIAAR